MRFIDKMNGNNFNLVVSCPVNDYDFVKAAWENGADAVKVHLNVNHHASGTGFKTLKEEYDFVERILSESPVPVGVVVGGSVADVAKDFSNVLEENFDFLSLYGHHATTQVLEQNKITKMIACDYSYTSSDIQALEKLGVEILEVSIMHQDDYGTSLTIKDLARYKHINNLVNIPTLIPTQKKIETSDLKSIRDVGFNGIMIGAVVTTKDFDTYVETIRSFRKAIDSL